MTYVLVSFALLILHPAIAHPTGQEPDPDENTNATVRVVLTSSTIAPTIKSRPGKELTKIEEKFKTLGCGIPTMVADAKLWKDNQTHELLLPTKVSASSCATVPMCIY